MALETNEEYGRSGVSADPVNKASAPRGRAGSLRCAVEQARWSLEAQGVRDVKRNECGIVAGIREF